MKLAGLAFISVVVAAPAHAATCESLATLTRPNTTILSASTQTAGSFVQPGAPGGRGGGANPLFARLPSFCRVTASLTPTADSDIRIEVWLPTSGWNGKLQSVGNGAWAGTIGYAALGNALAGGYATAATDTGHVGNTAKFVPGHSEKMIDYGYRAVHEMTLAVKAIVSAFYGDGPRLSYWNGCSTGGRQGLMEALRYPADYDGIIAGAPVNDRTHQLTWELWVAQAVHRDEARYIPPTKYPAIHQAALNACDARDGLKDDLIDDPRSCRFDPAVLECKNGDAASCLTRPQVEAARRIYSPAVNPKTKQQIFPALQPGSELGWGGLAGPQPVGEAVEFFQYVVFNDPTWDYRTLEFDTAADAADKAAAGVLNVTDPNLKPFFDRGGKLLLYHGWNDQLVAPVNSVNYYTRVTSMLDPGKAASSIRLFMMPGVNHCQGGSGPDTFDRMKVIEDWVERGQTPSRIDASHATAGTIDRTRPLCAYPQVARHTGSGSTDDAANFVCRMP
ncbi:MAG TPA: tannase/feruloyl esterase family alpha/beta hydrolase [Vicinamibacterales bacterium]